jgi:enoyl-CoA hydratase/carnithine racemase
VSYRTLDVSWPSADVAVVTLDRPDRLNAITFEMFDELTRVQAELADEDVRALVLTGAGRAFCAGLDLDEAALLPSMPAATMLREQTGWARAVAGFAELPFPVIAAVNGAAAGAGMALALMADVRIAASSARFNAAFVRIGLSGGDCGTSWTLPRLVGLSRASEILLTGRFVDAEEALAIGLVTAVVEPAGVLDRALQVATTIAQNSPVGVALTKQVLRSNVDAPSLDAALELENRNQVLATRTRDMTEALTAFREKRRPTFVGH